MIITCACGLKKFGVEDNQIPPQGRQVQCGYCSKEWFFKPEMGVIPEIKIDEENTSMETQESDTVKNEKSILNTNEADLPKDTEDIISQAEGYIQERKKLKIFDDLYEDQEARSNIDKKIKEHLTKKEKTNRSNIARRTRFLVYFLILLLLVFSVMLVPYKKSVLAIFPELKFYFDALTPYYEAIQTFFK